MAVPVLRHPARPGRQRRQEHPGGRSCRYCLRSRCQTPRDLPGAIGGETGTPAGDHRNPRPSGRGVVKRLSLRCMRRCLRVSRGLLVSRCLRAGRGRRGWPARMSGLARTGRERPDADLRWSGGQHVPVGHLGPAGPVVVRLGRDDDAAPRDRAVPRVSPQAVAAIDCPSVSRKLNRPVPPAASTAAIVPSARRPCGAPPAAAASASAHRNAESTIASSDSRAAARTAAVAQRTGRPRPAAGGGLPDAPPSPPAAPPRCG